MIKIGRCMSIVENRELTIPLVGRGNKIKIEGGIIIKDVEGLDVIRLGCHNPPPFFCDKSCVKEKTVGIKGTILHTNNIGKHFKSIVIGNDTTELSDHSGDGSNLFNVGVSFKGVLDPNQETNGLTRGEMLKERMFLTTTTNRLLGARRMANQGRNRSGCDGVKSTEPKTDLGLRRWRSVVSICRSIGVRDDVMRFDGRS